MASFVRRPWVEVTHYIFRGAASQHLAMPVRLPVCFTWLHLEERVKFCHLGFSLSQTKIRQIDWGSCKSLVQWFYISYDTFNIIISINKFRQIHSVIYCNLVIYSTIFINSIKWPTFKISGAFDKRVSFDYFMFRKTHFINLIYCQERKLNEQTKCII